MPDPQTPPPAAHARELARQKLILYVVVAVLLIGAGLIIVLAKSVALPMRLLAAGLDIVLAAAIWLLGRQQLGR